MDPPNVPNEKLRTPTPALEDPGGIQTGIWLPAMVATQDQGDPRAGAGAEGLHEEANQGLPELLGEAENTKTLLPTMTERTLCSNLRLESPGGHCTKPIAR